MEGQGSGRQRIDFGPVESICVPPFQWRNAHGPELKGLHPALPISVVITTRGVSGTSLGGTKYPGFVENNLCLEKLIEVPMTQFVTVTRESGVPYNLVYRQVYCEGLETRLTKVELPLWDLVKISILYRERFKVREA